MMVEYKPEWVKFLESMDRKVDGELTKEGKEFYDFLKKNTDKNCSCDCREINGHGRCVKCHLQIDDKKKEWDFIWLEPDNQFGRWMCITKELYLKIKKEHTFLLVQNKGRWWITLREYFYDKQKGVCPECEEEKSFEEMDLHHKISKSNGGIESEENLILLCRNCHHKFIRESLN